MTEVCSCSYCIRERILKEVIASKDLEKLEELIYDLYHQLTAAEDELAAYNYEGDE